MHGPLKIQVEQMLIGYLPRFTVAVMLLTVVSACAVNSDNSLALTKPNNSADPMLVSFELKPNPQVQSIVLKGTFQLPDSLSFRLASPSFLPPYADRETLYSITLDSSEQHWPVSLTEISKGETYFEVKIPTDLAYFEKLNLFHGSTLITRVANANVLHQGWLDKIELTFHTGQLCLTWPKEQFSSASLLSTEKGRLHLLTQLSWSGVCIAPEDYGVDVLADNLLINLRNNFVAVQLSVTPHSRTL